MNLTFILLIPIIVDRLNRPRGREDTHMVAFTISVFVIFLTWTFNYQFLMISILLPVGRAVWMGPSDKIGQCGNCSAEINLGWRVCNVCRTPIVEGNVNCSRCHALIP